MLFKYPIDVNSNHEAPSYALFTVHEKCYLSKLYFIFDIYTTTAYAVTRVEYLTSETALPGEMTISNRFDKGAWELGPMVGHGP